MEWGQQPIVRTQYRPPNPPRCLPAKTIQRVQFAALLQREKEAQTGSKSVMVMRCPTLIHINLRPAPRYYLHGQLYSPSSASLRRALRIGRSLCAEARGPCRSSSTSTSAWRQLAMSWLSSAATESCQAASVGLARARTPAAHA